MNECGSHDTSKTRLSVSALWLMILLLVSGCANREPAPASWLGATEAEVMDVFGKPSATLVNDEGNRVIVFTAASTLFFGTGEACDGFAEDGCRARGNMVLNQEDTGERAIVARCSVFFEFKNEVISKWTWGGRLCNRVYDSTFTRRIKPSENLLEDAAPNG